MHLVKSNIRYKYNVIENATVNTLGKCEWERFGVWIDDELKCIKHIEIAASKGNHILGLIKRSSVYKNGGVIKKLFTSHVRPLLEYSNVIWYPRFNKNAERLREGSEESNKDDLWASGIHLWGQTKAVGYAVTVPQKISRNAITSQRGSAWHCYEGHLLSIGKMRFSTSRPGKTNEYFVTKRGRRDNVGKIYKRNLVQIGCEMAPLRGGEI